jgi:hypothetical protein
MRTRHGSPRPLPRALQRGSRVTRSPLLSLTPRPQDARSPVSSNGADGPLVERLAAGRRRVVEHGVRSLGLELHDRRGAPALVELNS